jgi:hypothetical protein
MSDLSEYFKDLVEFVEQHPRFQIDPENLKAAILSFTGDDVQQNDPRDAALEDDEPTEVLSFFNH